MARGENPQYERSALGRFEGLDVYSAAEALLKGMLEADTAVSLVVGPAEGCFADLLRGARDEASAHVLRAHGLLLKPVPDASRGLTLALDAARAGEVAVALVPNRDLDRCAEAMARLAAAPLPAGAGLCVLLEDAPGLSVASCPRRRARALDLPTFEARDVTALRGWAELALRVTESARRATALVVHRSILRSGQTLAARPNRVAETVDGMLARRRRKRRPRLVEADGILRMVRKLELNRSRALPNPGERVPVGFITTGPADAVLEHVLHGQAIAERIPVLHVGVLHPLDETTIGRILTRCEEVLLFEPRGGAIEADVRRAAEVMRADGQRPALVRPLPGIGDLPVEHPTLMGRRLLEALRRHHPSVAAPPGGDAPPPAEAVTPPRGATIGHAAALRELRLLAQEVDASLRGAGAMEDGAIRGLVIDGQPAAEGAECCAWLETWTAASFEREGVAALRQVARDDRPAVLLIYAEDADVAQSARRLVRATVPADRADRLALETANLAEPEALLERCRVAVTQGRLTVIVVQDGPPPRYAVGVLERSFLDIDRLGFEPLQRVVWSLDRACAVRPPGEDDVPAPDAAHQRSAMLTEFRVTTREGAARHGDPLLRVRPLLEQVEVLRTRPPAPGWRRDAAGRPPLPEIVHRQAGRWRLHVAGFRGEGPGLTTRILCRAATRMGYAVRFVHDPATVAPGRRAWAQLLFVRPRATESMPPYSPRIPAGEADVVLGLDAAETLRALSSDSTLRVASPGHTFVVANAGHHADEGESEAAAALREELRATVADQAHAHPRLLEDFAGACRTWFHTDRLADLALLGAAFQLGLVPLTLDVLEDAIGEIEATRYGRLLEAFRFGRYLAVDQRLFSRPKDDRSEDVTRLVRRTQHLLARRRGVSRAAREQARQLFRTSVEAMPGLGETESGRLAQRDFVIALNRCYLWGGLEYAERYAKLVTNLYRADRAESARSLTRHAILPLAGAMLIRDAVYVATVATSAEHHRRLRQRLNIKRARADRVERRYLTRVEINAFGREVRADVRTSDWPARLAAMTRHVVPRGWRGRAREKALREAVVSIIERATHEAAASYDRHRDVLARLHAEALDNRLRVMDPEEVLGLLKAGEATLAVEAAAPMG